MCGIVGIVSRQAVPVRALDSAIACLHHRGPDDSGTYIDPEGGVGLGHTRLAIIDLSSGGHQPMLSEDGRVVLIFNGEIYNYKELRQDLERKGHSFKTQSDTEVLLASYLQYGVDALKVLDGIFAFAIYDKRSGELFLARDRLGVKPLYFSQTSAGFVFASELKALLAFPSVDRTLDPSAIRRYLTFLWSPGEQTPFKHVKKLGPGSAIIVGNGSMRQWTYWRLPPYRPRRKWTFQDCAAELRARLDACVRRQMMSDAPLGAFLSGGLDSSAIVAAARQWNPDIECFTIGPEDGVEPGAGDDLPFARRVAAHLGVSLSEIQVGPQAMFAKLADMVGILDEPIADPACLNVLFISELARSHGVKVLLSGVGGDDLFTGYRRHSLLAFEPIWGRVPQRLRQAAVRAASTLDRRSAVLRKLAKSLDVIASEGNARVTSAFMWGPPAGVDGLFTEQARQAFAGEAVAAPLAEFIEDAATSSAVEKCLMLEKRFFLGDHNLIYTDKMAMAAGVEVRVPFLDTDLVDFAAEVPVHWKQRLTSGKRILKESQRGILPADVIDRPKTGFGMPLRRWMQGDMKEAMEDLLSKPSLERRGLFDAAAVHKLIEDDRRGYVDAAYTLFSLMCIELWCRRFVDAPASMAEREGLLNAE